MSNNSYIRGIYTQAFEMNPTSLRCVDSWVHDTEDDDDESDNEKVQRNKPILNSKSKKIRKVHSRPKKTKKEARNQSSIGSKVLSTVKKASASCYFI